MRAVLIAGVAFRRLSVRPDGAELVAVLPVYSMYSCCIFLPRLI